MGDVVSLGERDEVGDGAVIDPGRILDQAQGRFQQIVVIGFDHDGEIALLASHGSREVLWALRLAENHLLFDTE